MRCVSGWYLLPLTSSFPSSLSVIGPPPLISSSLLGWGSTGPCTTGTVPSGSVPGQRQAPFSKFKYHFRTKSTNGHTDVETRRSPVRLGSEDCTCLSGLRLYDIHATQQVDLLRERLLRCET